MNKLAQETSPYLLQHADNPVDWFPWCDEAFAAARDANKPILLSIGYSACHWCHVMAHESFEDASTAEIMNRLFINIKVDREERPDVDKIYQTAHQLITQRAGGWPLTVFLTPDGQLPFFAGTYFPREARYGMPAFTDLLLQIAQHYEHRKTEVVDQGEAVIAAIAKVESSDTVTSGQLDSRPIAKLRKQLEENFDAEWGGFGDAPKFPHPSSLEFLLRHWRSTAHQEEPDVHALFMCALTLTRMVDGGIYDQLGGGFFRYSVDQYWSIPHFEKMLYDNGPLLALLAQLWQASGDDTFRAAADATANWALREMRDAGGAFYASLDADSEGEEGKFYVWTPDQLSELLGQQELAVATARYGLDQAANFEGKWHLQNRASLDVSANTASVTESRATGVLKSANEKLLQARNNRVWPGRDDKILVSWNALLIRGLAIAGRILNRDDLVTASANSVDFIRTQMLDDSGRLLASYKDGRARFQAYLDDYAFLLDALLELLQARWNSEHLAFATQLADALLMHFEDCERGGFYFTANDHEQLAHRPRTFSDDSLPSGNAISGFALGRLGHLLGKSRYLEATERTLMAGWQAMLDFPHGHAALVMGLDEYLAAPEIVVIRGNEAECQEWARNIQAVYAPRRLVFAIPTNATELPGSLALRKPNAQDNESPVAYVCQGTSCSTPITDFKELVAMTSDLAQANKQR